METKTTKNLLSHILFLVFLIYFYDLTGQELKDRPIKIEEPVYLKQEVVQTNKSDNKTLNKRYRLLENSSVYRIDINSNDIGILKKQSDLLNIENNIIGQYLYTDTNKKDTSLLKYETTNDIRNEFKPKLIENFRVILDIDDRVYFTDGSLFIFFNNKNVNFSEFASVYNLMLKKEYIDLNMGVYVFNNFNRLEDLIDLLEQIDTVSKVEYNVINPYIMPE